MHGLSGWMGGLVAAGVITFMVGAAPVRAVAPLGACCLENGGCADLVSFQCLEQGGSFIGNDTSCATVNCDASVAVPMLSIAGLVAALGALCGLGAYRLLFRRRER